MKRIYHCTSMISSDQIIQLLRVCACIYLFSQVPFGAFSQTFTVNSSNVVNVSDYGAIPNDGIDDEDEIQDAIDAAGDSSIVRFQAGTYILRVPDSRFSTTTIGHVVVDDKTDITLEGAVDGSGKPATHIERILEYPVPAGVIVPSIISARRNDGVKIENITFDNSDKHYSAGEVIAVNSSSVTVDVLSDYSIDDGCPNTATNVWEWDGSPSSDDVLKIGAESLSYASADGNWSHGAGREMTLARDYDSDVDVGDYISWHYGTPSAGTIYLLANRRIILENVHVYNGLRSCVFIAYSQDISVKDVEIRSKDGRFAVGPRDGIHSSRNIGEYYVDNLYVKGTRLDAFVAAGTAATVDSIADDRTFRFETDLSLGGGSSFGSTFGDGNGGFQSGMVCLERPIYFFQNGLRHKVEVETAEYISTPSGSGSIYEVTTQSDIPSFVSVGTVLSPGGLTSDTVQVRNSTFESIAGSAQVLFCDNSNSFDNTYSEIMYAAIRFGANPSRNHAGINHRVASSTFTDCAWRVNLNNPTDETNEYGYINCFNANTQGKDFEDMDVGNIVIEDNTFVSNYSTTGTDSGRAGIIIDEAYDIVIQNNSFSGITNRIELRDVQGTINTSIQSGAIYRLENVQSGYFLRGYDPGSANTHSNDAYVTMYPDVPSWATMKWSVEEYVTHEDRYKLENIYSDRALRGYDPASANPTDDGEKVTVRDPVAWSTMMWKFIPVEDEENRYYIQNNSSGMYLEGSSTQNGYATQSSSNSSTDTQWELVFDHSGSSRLDSEEFLLASEGVNDMIIYPNSTSNTLKIEWGVFQEVSILSSEGRIIKSFGKELKEIDISDFPKGLYLMVFKSGNTSVVRKLVRN